MNAEIFLDMMRQLIAHSRNQLAIKHVPILVSLINKAQPTSVFEIQDLVDFLQAHMPELVETKALELDLILTWGLAEGYEGFKDLIALQQQTLLNFSLSNQEALVTHSPEAFETMLIKLLEDGPNVLIALLSYKLHDGAPCLDDFYRNFHQKQSARILKYALHHKLLDLARAVFSYPKSPEQLDEMAIVIFGYIRNSPFTAQKNLSAEFASFVFQKGRFDNTRIIFCEWSTSTSDPKVNLPTAILFELIARIRACPSDKPLSSADHVWVIELCQSVIHESSVALMESFEIYNLLRSFGIRKGWLDHLGYRLNILEYVLIHMKAMLDDKAAKEAQWTDFWTYITPFKPTSFVLLNEMLKVLLQLKLALKFEVLAPNASTGGHTIDSILNYESYKTGFQAIGLSTWLKLIAASHHRKIIKSNLAQFSDLELSSAYSTLDPNTRVYLNFYRQYQTPVRDMKGEILSSFEGAKRYLSFYHQKPGPLPIAQAVDSQSTSRQDISAKKRV